MGFAYIIAVILGIIAGWYWYKRVDEPREKMFERMRHKHNLHQGHPEKSVFDEHRDGTCHSMDKSSDDFEIFDR